MKLLITGGQQRRRRTLTDGSGRWYKYVRGHIVEADVATGQTAIAFSYETPSHLVPADEPAVLFKQGYKDGDRLYLATMTEVLVCRYPSFEVEAHISLPSFIDVHHVRPSPRGTLLVVNTGLDQLVEMTTDGEVVDRWNVLGKDDPWGRHDPTVDYRRVDTTKPYDSHPNHVFLVDGEVWVTRFMQRDAISIDDPNRRIDIGLERVHDGVVHDGHVFFTTVDGQVAVADVETLEIVDVIDLNEVQDDNDILGWCRGIVFDDEGTAWIGFSRLRPTAIRENVAWVKDGFRRSLGTHVARYDLSGRKLLDRIELEQLDLNAVFSIFTV